MVDPKEIVQFRIAKSLAKSTPPSPA